MQQRGNGILIIAAPAAGEKLGGVLSSSGYDVIRVTGSAYQGMAVANEQGAGLAVVTQTLPDLPGIEVANQLERVCPVILLCTPQQSEWTGVLGRHIIQMTAPIKTRPFIDAVEMSLWRRSFAKPPTERSGRERQLIDMAKRRLMDAHRIDEPAAHRQLQKMSMDSGKPLSEVARIVLELL